MVAQAYDAFKQKCHFISLFSPPLYEEEKTSLRAQTYIRLSLVSAENNVTQTYFRLSLVSVEKKL